MAASQLFIHSSLHSLCWLLSRWLTFEIHTFQINSFRRLWQHWNGVEEWARQTQLCAAETLTTALEFADVWRVSCQKSWSDWRLGGSGEQRLGSAACRSVGCYQIWLITCWEVLDIFQCCIWDIESVCTWTIRVTCTENVCLITAVWSACSTCSWITVKPK